MTSHLPESDWRHFKDIHAKVLERYCCRILEEVAAVTRSTDSTAHDRYLKLYKLIEERDKQIAGAFNDFRRSTAVMQLGIMRRMKLLTDEELGCFSEQTQRSVEGIASL